MTSGGARARSGPPPDPNAQRRDRPADAATWTHLPAAGREGEPPAWPLPRPTRREQALWLELWRLPQAIMWERNRQTHEVAVHVRTRVQAETRDAPSSILAEYRRQLDALGLSEAGRDRHRWTIDGTSAEVPNPAYRPAGRRTPDKGRFLDVIEGGGA